MAHPAEAVSFEPPPAIAANGVGAAVGENVVFTNGVVKVEVAVDVPVEVPVDVLVEDLDDMGVDVPVDSLGVEDAVEV